MTCYLFEKMLMISVCKAMIFLLFDYTISWCSKIDLFNHYAAVANRQDWDDGEMSREKGIKLCDAVARLFSVYSLQGFSPSKNITSLC